MKRLRKLNSVLKVVILIVFIVCVSIVAIGIFSLYIENNYKDYKVSGNAMAPTLTTGETIKTTRHTGPIKRADIVAFNAPDKYGTLVERVVALGNEKIVINHNDVTVYNSSYPNGFDPDTSYLPSGVLTTGNVSRTIPQGDVYVLGDNRLDSLDSRVFGPIPTSSIISVEIGIVN